MGLKRCQKRQERKLHLEKSVGNRSWRFELSPLRTKMLCSRAVCLGVWEVQKWLSCYCSCWKRSIVTDSKYQGGYAFPPRSANTHTHAYNTRNVTLKHTEILSRHMLDRQHALNTFRDSLTQMFYLSKYLRSSPDFVIHAPVC